LKGYQLTEEGFRSKCRERKAEDGETPSQFIIRLSTYLARWVELAKIDMNYDCFFELMVKEQFLANCTKDLAMYSREKAKMKLEEFSNR